MSHDFPIFTDEKYTRDMSVMQWGKHNVSNALNSTDIFAVCHGGSIWSMIDIKGCLRIIVHKLVRLCELKWSFITTFAPIWFDLFGHFKSGFGLFLRSLWCCDSSYSSAAVMSERLRHSFERRNQSKYKILVTDYWSLYKQQIHY